LRTTDTDGSGVGGTGFSPSVHTLDHIKVIDRSRGSSPFPCHPIPPFLPCLVSLSFDVACVLLSLLHSPSPHSISMPQTHGLDKLSPPVTLVDPRRKPARRTNGRSRVERSRSGQGGVFDYATVRPAFTFAAFPQLAFVKGTLKVVVIAPFSTCRGAGYTFGAQVFRKFLSSSNMVHILRAHQICMEGFSVLYDDKLSTVWSAPDYCYRCGNLASTLEVGPGG
jgi:hypothetical protein